MNKLTCNNCGIDIKRGKWCSDACRMKFKRANTESDKPNETELTNRGDVTDAPGDKVTDSSLSKINELLAKKGLPPMIRASDLPRTEWVSSGIKEIDELTKGFPRQRITEIFGMKGVGKTQLLAKITGNNKSKLTIFYVDAENSLRQDQLENSGNLQFFQGFILEDIAEAVESALQSNEYDLIVIDSVASLVPRNESEGNLGEWQMGLKARLMNQWMRKINYWLWKSKSAVVFVNQQRDTFNSWGTVRFTPGGHALPYAASLRIELKSGKTDKKEKYQLVTAIVEKSRFDRPYKTAEFKLYYEA